MLFFFFLDSLEEVLLLLRTASEVFPSSEYPLSAGFAVILVRL